MNIIANILHRHLDKDIVDTIMYNIWREEHISKFSQNFKLINQKHTAIFCIHRNCSRNLSKYCTDKCVNKCHNIERVIYSEKVRFSYLYEYIENKGYTLSHSKGRITIIGRYRFVETTQYKKFIR
jgi:hypothetical protein